jgi:uncharacterized RDD family membrane protein YckC
MRCPKCRYISFERVERCRNCGYDFSFTPDAPSSDLPLRDAGSEVEGPLSDFSIEKSDDLPLFEPPAEVWRAATTRTSQTPRAPLGVRRSTAALARAAVTSPQESARLDLEPFTSEPRSNRAPDPTAEQSRAGAPRRLFAGIIDLAIIAGVDAAVLYLTLRLLDLNLDNVLVLPLVPFVGFLLVLNGGYLAAFTAACGQTIGKMAAGIRVVSAPEGESHGGRVSFGFAALRTVAYLASALPVGLGFIPAFIGRERRGLHDRLAETRVIRVSPVG